MHYAVVKRAVHNQESGKATLDLRQCVVNDCIMARALNFEIDDGCTPRRHSYGLHASDGWRAEARALVHVIKDLADHMEGRCEVGTTDAKIDTDRLPNAGAQRMRFGQCANSTIKNEIFRPLGNQFLVVHLLIAMRTERLGGVDLALHDIELAIDLR